ncbi:uncharacterized protein V6R79_020321 [Siganus canaliculatus]
MEKTGASSQSLESILLLSGVEENPRWAVVLLCTSLGLGFLTFLCVFLIQHNRLRVFKHSLVLFLSLQQGRLKGVQNVHASLIALLATDVLHLMTTIIFATELSSSCLGSTTGSCQYSSMFWVLTKHLAVVLHVVTALVSVWFLCQPQSADKLRCLFALVVQLFLVLAPVYIFISNLSMLAIAVLIAALTLATVWKCIYSRQYHYATSWRIPMVILAVITFSVIAPSFVLQCQLLVQPSRTVATVYMYLLFVSNFQLVLDGLLCLCVLKLFPAEEESQQVME